MLYESIALPLSYSGVGTGAILSVSAVFDKTRRVMLAGPDPLGDNVIREEEPMDYDNAARVWDDDPVRREQAAAVARAIRRHLPSGGSRGTALELGCGTGLLSFNLADAFERLVLMDDSDGMLAVAAEKIKRSGLIHLEPRRGDFHHIPDDGIKYDAVYMLMAFHHARDPRAVLRHCYEIMAPGGLLFIADLDSEDGSFHAAHPDFNGWNGFDRSELTRDLEGIGFGHIEFETVFTIQKNTAGRDRAYPVFLVKAIKT